MQNAGFTNGLVNNKSGYMNEIKRLRKSNDPQKQQKIALVQQAYTNWLLQKQQSSGGGSRGYSSGYGGGYGGGYGSGSSSSSPGDAAKEAAGKTTANIVNGLANGIIAQTNKGNKNKNKNKSSYGQYYSGDWRRYY